MNYFLKLHLLHLLFNKLYQFKDEEEEDNNAEINMKDLLNKIPKPQNASSINIEEDEDDILLKNETKNQFIKPKKQTNKVKISVPSLSEVCI